MSPFTILGFKCKAGGYPASLVTQPLGGAVDEIVPQILGIAMANHLFLKSKMWGNTASEIAIDGPAAITWLVCGIVSPHPLRRSFSLYFPAEFKK